MIELVGTAVQPMVAKAHNSVGKSYKRLGLHEEAAESHTRAYDILKTFYHTDAHPAVLEAADEVADSHQNLGRHADALKMYSQNLALKLEVFGTDEHGSVATTMLSMGALQIKTGAARAAVPTLQRAADIFEARPRRSPGECAPAGAAEAYEQLGIAHTRCLALNAALKAGERALALYDGRFPNGMNVKRATLLCNLGLTHQAIIGNEAKALDHFQRCVDLFAALNGGVDPAQPTVLAALESIVTLLRGLGDAEGADKAEARRTAVGALIGANPAPVSGLTRAQTLFDTAVALEAKGDHKRAWEALERCLELRLEVFEGDEAHKDVASVLQRIASNLELRRQYGTAAKTYKRLLRIHTALARTKDNEESAKTYEDMSDMYETAGDTRTANVLAAKALKIRNSLKEA